MGHGFVRFNLLILKERAHRPDLELRQGPYVRSIEKGLEFEEGRRHCRRGAAEARQSVKAEGDGLVWDMAGSRMRVIEW